MKRTAFSYLSNPIDTGCKQEQREHAWLHIFCGRNTNLSAASGFRLVTLLQPHMPFLEERILGLYAVDFEKPMGVVYGMTPMGFWRVLGDGWVLPLVRTYLSSSRCCDMKLDMGNVLFDRSLGISFCNFCSFCRVFIMFDQILVFCINTATSILTFLFLLMYAVGFVFHLHLPQIYMKSNSWYSKGQLLALASSATYTYFTLIQQYLVSNTQTK